MNRTALILDGETRAALAVVRSLGCKGLALTVASHDERGPACVSRYTARRLRSPDPNSEPKLFIRWLIETVTELRPDILIPITDTSVSLALENEHQLRPLTKLPFVDYGLFHRVSHKDQLIREAQEIGVAVPRTLFVPAGKDRTKEIYQQVESFPYPAVLKAVSSAPGAGQVALRLPVSYYDNPNELLLDLEDTRTDANHPNSLTTNFLLQQRIIGEGLAVFALCRDGKALATFCHRRLLEKPPTGGVSVLSESVECVEAPVDVANRLLARYNWNGVAMVEFKRHSDGLIYLIEINPRFWGSLQLAVDSGVDFPALLDQFTSCLTDEDWRRLEEACAQTANYKRKQRLRWTLGNLDHVIARFNTEGTSALKDILLHNTLRLLERPFQTRHETFRISDPMPFFNELLLWFEALKHR